MSRGASEDAYKKMRGRRFAPTAPMGFRRKFIHSGNGWF
jgi:hypothetical protein